MLNLVQSDEDSSVLGGNSLTIGPRGTPAPLCGARSGDGKGGDVCALPEDDDDDVLAPGSAVAGGTTVGRLSLRSVQVC